MVGLMSSFSALSQARAKGLDLVEINDKSHPPICKIMDYGKWKFENKKREKQNRRNQSKVLLKEIQLKTGTDTGDINIKMEKARAFLKQGHKVKVNLRFFGREMAHKDLGWKLLKQVEERLSDLAFAETLPKMERRLLFAVFAPASGGSAKKPAPATAFIPPPLREEEKKDKTLEKPMVIQSSASAPTQASSLQPPSQEKTASPAIAFNSEKPKPPSQEQTDAPRQGQKSPLPETSAPSKN